MSNNVSRLTTIILVCSLAINLLLVGGLVGHLVSRGSMKNMPPIGLGWMLRGLDDRTKQSLRPEFEAHMTRSMPLRREMRAAQQAFETVLLSPDIDEAALDIALARLRKASDAFQQSSHEQMVRVIKQLDAEQRQQMVQFLHSHHPGGRRGDGKHDERGDRGKGPDDSLGERAADRTPPKDPPPP